MVEEGNHEVFFGVLKKNFLLLHYALTRMRERERIGDTSVAVKIEQRKNILSLITLPRSISLLCTDLTGKKKKEEGYFFFAFFYCFFMLFFFLSSLVINVNAKRKTLVSCLPVILQGLNNNIWLVRRILV